MRLVVDGERCVRIVAESGETRRALEPPPGYAFSYADGPATLVCRGEAPVDGFWDWRFSVDEESGALERLGPAY